LAIVIFGLLPIVLLSPIGQRKLAVEGQNAAESALLPERSR
jgi:hypothetical protein